MKNNMLSKRQNLIISHDTNGRTFTHVNFYGTRNSSLSTKFIALQNIFLDLIASILDGIYLKL